MWNLSSNNTNTKKQKQKKKNINKSFFSFNKKDLYSTWSSKNEIKINNDKFINKNKPPNKGTEILWSFLLLSGKSIILMFFLKKS